MKEPMTGPQQNALLDVLLSAAQADARSYAAQAHALITLHDLAGREETTLSKVPQFPVLELAGTLRISQQSVTVRALEADRLHTALPLTLAALTRGELLLPHAKTLLEVTKNLPATLATRVEAALLPAATTWTTSDLRRKATSTVLQIESELDAQRGTDHQGDRLSAARANRKVTVRPEADGMASLWALLPAEKAIAFRQNLDELTRRAKLTDHHAGITRTADQRRADLLAELPSLVLHGHRACPTTSTSTSTSGNPSGDGGGAGGCRAPQPTGLHPIGILLSIMVPMDTALDRGVQPATLTGYGPISAAHVRLLRPTAHIRPVYIDSRSGQPLAVGDKTHPPPAAVPGEPAPRAERATPAPPIPTQAEQEAPAEQAEQEAPAEQAEQAAPAEQSSQKAQTGHQGDPPERQLPPRAGEPGQHRSRPAQWDPASFHSVVQQFAQPVEVTDTAEPQHDPSRRLTRLLRLRDVRCAGPGCSVPAARCDRDHLTPYGAPGGHTAAWNLRHLSRRCHRAKHHGWTLTVHPDGNASWLSPLGRTYDRPSPHDPPHPTRWAHEGTAAGWLVDARAIQTTTEADWDWGHDQGTLASNPSTSNPNASDPNSSDPNSSDRAGRGLVDGLPGQGQAGDPPPF